MRLRCYPERSAPRTFRWEAWPPSNPAAPRGRPGYGIVLYNTIHRYFSGLAYSKVSHVVADFVQRDVKQELMTEHGRFSARQPLKLDQQLAQKYGHYVAQHAFVSDRRRSSELARHGQPWGTYRLKCPMSILCACDQTHA